MQDAHGPDAAAPRSARYESLDLWRGVACLLVVFCHSVDYVRPSFDTPLQEAATGVTRAFKWGWVGVPIFFVISGYCIGASVDGARRRRTGVGAYFWRRFRRIYPPYWCFLLLTVLLVVVTESLLCPGLFVDDRHPIHSPGSLTAWQWLGNVTLTESWRHHVAGDGRLDFVVHSWTLCYEEQFYAVMGVILLLAPRRVFAAVGVLALAVLALRHLAGWLGFTGALSGFFFDGRWLLFAAGVLVYYQITRGSRRVTVWARLLLILGVAYALRTPSDVDYGCLVAFGFALVISVLHPLDARLAAAPVLRPLMACGTMCYSVYLVHFPLAKGISHALTRAGVSDPVGTLAVTVPVCVAASVAAAVVFHRLVERRFLNAPRPTARPEGVGGTPLLRGACNG